MTHQLGTLPPHVSLDPPFDPNLLIIFARFSEQPQIIFETTVSCFESQANATNYDVATWNITTAI
jgi:hypothetical protein